MITPIETWQGILMVIKAHSLVDSQSFVKVVIDL